MEDDGQGVISKICAVCFYYALEAEYITPLAISELVIEDFAEILVWGEISNGDMKNLWFRNIGDFVELTLTEQFETSNVLIVAAVGQSSGIFDIYVNDTFIHSQDLYSNHAGITSPYIDLCLVNLVKNSFKINFVFKGTNKAAKMKNQNASLGFDFFLVGNNFLKR